MMEEVSVPLMRKKKSEGEGEGANCASGRRRGSCCGCMYPEW